MNLIDTQYTELGITTYLKGISDECGFLGDDSTFLSSGLALPDLLNHFS